MMKNTATKAPTVISKPKPRADEIKPAMLLILIELLILYTERCFAFLAMLASVLKITIRIIKKTGFNLFEVFVFLQG